MKKLEKNSYKIKPNILYVTLIVTIAAMFRFIPHPPNFTPIAAIALFGGAYYTNKTYAFGIPLLAMFLTDAIIGFHSLSWLVYFSFAVIVLFGIILLKKVSVKNIILAALLASISFFIITNFGVWVISPIYSKDLTGLVACYIAAIPFFSYNVIGDLFYSGVFFGLYEYIRKISPALAETQV